MASEDKNWAKEYLLDPLTEPQPSEETGPGSHFRRETENTSSGMITPPQSTPSRHAPAKQVNATTAEVPNGYPSPGRSPATHRQEALGPQRGHARQRSLEPKFPGDMSHRPLDQLRHEKAVADKARHVTKKHHIQADGVDKLDEAAAGGAYHHGGPYDATLWARNNSYTSSPVKAVASTNREALKATPKERIQDSLQGHRPLDGVASYAPGEIDANGDRYNYQKGENMMTDLNPEGGAYKRWPGIQYHPDDIKGKGEPAYSLEKALKKHDDGADGALEMTDRPRSSSLGQALRGEGFDNGSGVKRSDSLSKRLSGGLKKRIGSLKKTSRQEE